MTSWRPGLALTLVAALGCGGDSSGARADSAKVPATTAAAPAAAGADSAATSTDSAVMLATAHDSLATPSAAAASLDSLKKVAHHHPPMPRPAAGALSEETVQGVLDAINASDAAIAGAAVSKVSNAEVKRFAAALASAHSQKVTETPPLKDEARALVAPLRELQAQSTAKLDGMSAGPSFDRAFVEAQIAAHERAMAVLDSIRPAAQTGVLPALVAGARAQVAKHLDQARTLQRRLPP